MKPFSAQLSAGRCEREWRLVRRIILTVAFVAAPAVILAQPAGKIPRVGVIGDQGPTEPRIEAFRQGLRELGYTEGKSILVEYRYLHGLLDRVPGTVAELLGLKVDVLVVAGGVPALAAKAQTRTVPIVFMVVGDPVGVGLVSSLARPGGNVTGLSSMVTDTIAKQLELLKAAVPHVTRIGILHNPANPIMPKTLELVRQAGQLLGLDLQFLEVRRPSDLVGAFAALKAGQAGAVLAISDPLFGNELVHYATLAAVNRLPSLYNRKEFAEAGGLMAYGPNFSDNAKRAATYVHKILKGTKPAELPVEQPTRLELVINLQTAKSLGLTIPPTVLLRADRVIE